MQYILPMIKKELRVYLNSSIAYITGIFFLLSNAIYFFYMSQFQVNDMATLRDYFQLFPIVIAILIPAITMRSFSEEYKTGTIEIITTFPLSEWKIVFAKFFASVILFFVILLFSLIVPISLFQLGDFDLNIMATQYFGVLLLGSTAIAIGQYISSLTKNQITAFLVSFFVLIVIVFFGRTEFKLPSVISFLKWISLDYHFQGFRKGLLDSRDLLYFLLLTFIFLFLNKNILVSRKY